MKSVKSISPGKSILFGEHAVVYGYPAIAMAVSITSSAIIRELKDPNLIIDLKDNDLIIEVSDLKELISNIPSKYSQYGRCLEIFQKRFDLQIENIEIILQSELFPGAGLGSSASLSVALVSALNSYYETGLEKNGINEIAYELEKIIHGTPSGIDNTITTFGNAIYYQKSEFNFIDLTREIPLLITYSNIEHNTKEAIDRIRNLKEKNPQKVQKILKNIGKITEEAKKELQRGNYQEIGELMNLNQKYLAELKVSNKAISQIVDISTQNGAYGSKLTGAGLGGCVISIGEKDMLKNIADILKDQGFRSFLAENDKKGVRIEQ
ncbi:MAG: putative Mevalonate kinase [Promethearchaeota archaeon]|nr:MAG: putative Mevalonate kinase [Candidatus Lokiarchaeota archaeon]